MPSNLTDCGLNPELRPMVAVKNAWKSFNGIDYILKDLSIDIPKGKIYSILGASGVGKTTLLKCITGNLALDSGKLEVDVKSRLDMGYMPQELALYTELTVQETFYVFGMVFYMIRSQIIERMDELTNLLELPHKETKICTLSGGQQRRISIAVALLNNPNFLILDEPTVSLDALLKKSIWNYLERISKIEGKTILLTTHYIEEATHSDLVAFINNGSVLQEGHPAEVIAATNCNTLEQAYYNLCHNQMTNKSELKCPEVTVPAKRNNSEYFKYSNTRMVALLLKSWYYLKRNFVVFYVFIFTPALLTLLITETVKRPRNLNVGFVNMESDCLISDVMNCSTPLSCRFLEKLRDCDFNMIKFNDLDEGKEAVRRNQVWGMVKFNSNFSDGVINRLEYFYALDKVEISDEDEARVWLDMSMFPIGHMLKKNFYDAYLNSIQDWYTDCGWNAKAAHPILKQEKPIFGKVDESLLTSCVPGITVMLVFSCSFSLALILILSEKELGTFERCRVSGMTLWELLVSEFLFCFFAMIPSGAAQLLILYFYSGPANAPVPLSVLLIYLIAATGILFGLLTALLTDNLSVALLVSISLMNSFYYLAGVMWPIEGSHRLTRFINSILPSTIPVATMMDMANRGSTLTDPRVYHGFINSVVWILILLILITFLVYRSNNKR